MMISEISLSDVASGDSGLDNLLGQEHIGYKGQDAIDKLLEER